MNPPDESLLKALMDWATPLLAALFGLVWSQQRESAKAMQRDHQKQIDDLGKLTADKFTVINRENREDVVRIFSQLEEHSRRSEERHFELLKALHEGLSKKADK